LLVWNKLASHQQSMLFHQLQQHFPPPSLSFDYIASTSSAKWLKHQTTDMCLWQRCGMLWLVARPTTATSTRFGDCLSTAGSIRNWTGSLRMLLPFWMKYTWSFATIIQGSRHQSRRKWALLREMLNDCHNNPILNIPSVTPTSYIQFIQGQRYANGTFFKAKVYGSKSATLHHLFCCHPRLEGYPEGKS